MAQVVRSERREQLDLLWERAALLAEGEDGEFFQTRARPAHHDQLNRIESIWRRAKNELVERSRNHLERVQIHLDAQVEALAFWQNKSGDLRNLERESPLAFAARLRSNPQITYEVCDEYIQQYTASTTHAEEILRSAQRIHEILESLPSSPFEESK